MNYVLGVDHGGTKTHAVAADTEGNILAFADNSDMDISVYPDDRDLNIYITVYTIEKALAAANLSAKDISACIVGYCGADWDFEFPAIKKELSDLTGIENLSVINDSLGALRGGTDKPYGGIVCVGTGLNCAFRNKKGEELVFGYFVSDKDSGGIALGQMVLDAVCDGYIGIGEPTVLEKLVIDYLNIDSIKNAKDLLIAVRPGTRDIMPLNFERKILAPLLFKAEKMNDKVAKEIIVNYANRLVKYLKAGIEKLGMKDDEFDIVLSGGILKGSNTIMETINGQIGGIAPRASLVQAKYEPVCGLVFMCFENLLGYPLPSKLLSRFDGECQKRGLYRNVGETI